MLNLLATTLSVSVVILLFYAVKYIIKILKTTISQKPKNHFNKKGITTI
ncbi:hypothetical protein [Priestia aryabhattai]